jgi:nucleotide-binding universal stress UspA family protein
MIKKIVTAIDGSATSMSACEYAFTVAKSLGAHVEVLFVVDRRKTQIPFMYAGGAYDIAYERIYIPPDQELKQFYDKLSEDLYRFAENCIARCREMAEKAQVEMEAEIKEGFPAEIIAEVGHSGDLLVLGRRGENAEYKRETVGSTTEEVIRRSPRPVIVVTASYREPKRILFPYDESRSAENALQFYIHSFAAVAEELIFLCAEDVESDLSPVETEIEYLREHNVQVRVVKDEKPPIHAIGKVAEQENVDMVMMGSHGHHKLVDYLIGSTTVHVIRKSDLPVLVVY